MFKTIGDLFLFHKQFYPTNRDIPWDQVTRLPKPVNKHKNKKRSVYDKVQYKCVSSKKRKKIKK